MRRLGGDRVDKKPRTALIPSCKDVQEVAETFLHMQLACKLRSRRVAIQGAHDDVMKVLEEEVMREATPGRYGICAHRVWNCASSPRLQVMKMYKHSCDWK